RTAKRTLASLGDLPRSARCGPCEVELTTDGPHAVEVTFGVHPAIRAVSRQTYCYSETSSKAHVKVQQPVAPSSRRVVEVALAPGRYRARVVGEAGHRAFDVVEGSAVAEVTLGEDLLEGRALEVRPRATVTLLNGGDRPR